MNRIVALLMLMAVPAARAEEPLELTDDQDAGQDGRIHGAVRNVSKVDIQLPAKAFGNLHRRKRGGGYEKTIGRFVFCSYVAGAR